MIEIRDIHKSFGETEVLKGISATFEPGKCNLIIGSSGSGKTVMIKCMVGLFEVTQGNVFYDNRNFTNMSLKERIEIRKEIGMTFQGSALFDSMTVEENIMFPLNMFTSKTRKEKLDRVNFCLERVNLVDSNSKFPSEISGGMMKRVALARAIVLDPKYLFCDEPNSGLDPKTALLIDKLISEITKDLEITTIMNTHDMNSVMGIGDKVIYLHQGKKEWEGNKSEILKSTNVMLNDFIFSSDFLKELRDLSI